MTFETAKEILDEAKHVKHMGDSEEGSTYTINGIEIYLSRSILLMIDGQYVDSIRLDRILHITEEWYYGYNTICIERLETQHWGRPEKQ